MDPEFIKSIFNQYLVCNGPEIPARSGQVGSVNDVDISVESSRGVDGKHYASRIKRILLHAVSPNGENVNASIIIKARKNPLNRIRAINDITMFRTETEMYSTLLPLMRNLMTQAGDKREALWPIMYGHQSAELLAFQDLTGLGFEVKNMTTGLSAEDSLLVVQNIARFHAMSKSLVDRSFVNLPSWESVEVVVNRMFSTLFVVLCHSMETDWDKKWMPIKDWIRDHHNDVLHTFTQLHLECDKRFHVVNHGDLWTSNIMFRQTDSENSLTSSVRFIDFQLSNVNSFIWDLEFFFWSSLNPRVRTTMKSLLLKEYQKSLEANLKILGYSGYIPTMDDVIAESKRIEISGLVFLLFGAVVRSDVPQAIAMDKLMTHSPLEFVDKAIFTELSAQQNVGEDLKSLSELGIIPST